MIIINRAICKHIEFQDKQTNVNFIADITKESKSLHSSKICTSPPDCTLTER